ncbi:MAG: hypothetical protein ACKOXR_02195 [Bacteroidota bacterium]
MKKILILFLLFIAYGINLSAQVFNKNIVFQGSFELTDTVYVLLKKGNVKYTVAFDSVHIMMQPLLGMITILRITEAGNLTIIYHDKKYKRRNNSPSKQITVVKSRRKRLIVKKQEKQLYL